MKKTTLLIAQGLINLIPLAYLILLWPGLPESLPIHWNAQNEVDRFGSKTELLVLSIVMASVTLGVSLLILNLNKLDPKKKFNDDSSLSKKISWTIAFFIPLLSLSIIHESVSYGNGDLSFLSGKYIALIIALLIAALGNFMNNIRPNYFVGIRTPWNLENEENWRQTHRFASKLWFFGGLAIFCSALILPKTFTILLVLFPVIILAIIPVWYSYRIYRNSTPN